MIFHDIDGVRIPFDKSWSSIAVSVSGGADSALLAVILCTLNDNRSTVHLINHIRMWKTRPWQQYDFVRVREWLFGRFPDTEFVIHTNFIAPDLEYGRIGPSLKDEYDKSVSGDNIQQRAYAEFVCDKHDIPAYYNAVTCNPKTAEFAGMKERDIEPSETNQHLVLMEHMGRYACHPFRFTDKSWILKQYKNLDIWDLFEQTRSCEGEFENITYQTYTPGQYVPICGECFWCKEREWAIEYTK
jgi:7-cyano-7-deazaguanine synthase in queuosine biosynthesis